MAVQKDRGWSVTYAPFAAFRHAITPFFASLDDQAAERRSLMIYMAIWRRWHWKRNSAPLVVKPDSESHLQLELILMPKINVGFPGNFQIFKALTDDTNSDTFVS